MKKLLLAGTAISGFVMFAAPVMADGLKLEVGGFYRGYAVYSDNDETTTAAPGDESRDFDFRDDMELHFSGETTLDNGLTVGAHAEIDIAENSVTNTADEAYAYFSGSWGRVNFGHEDGAQYLLQVAAPSADSLVDGMRVQFQSVNFTNIIATVNAFDATNSISGAFDNILDYGNDMGRHAMKLTYFTPKYNGFQAGVSFAPEVTDGIGSVGNGTAVIATQDDLGQFENLWELAARWDGNLQGVGLSLGAGYSTASTEDNSAATTSGSDDRSQWNVAASASMNGFSFGASYSEDDFGLGGVGAGDGQETWVVGLGWDNGPYHLGVSYFDTSFEYGSAANQDFDADRLSFGGTYTYGPGMTFRGAVAFGELEDSTTPANDADFTQVTIGTMVNF